MTAKDWDALADDFSARVLEISECDVDGVIAATARRLGGKRMVGMDFGCGAGGVTRVMAPHFKTVRGVDFSPKLIDAARAKTNAGNIEYAVADLTDKRALGFSCDVGFCANVLIGADAALRDRIARNIIASIKRGGRGVFIAPSLESVLRAYQVGVQLRMARGAKANAMREVEGWVRDEIVSLPLGLVNMGAVPTKHYLQDELAEFLTAGGLRDVEVTRVSYPWSEALENIPKNFKAAPPWDWMAVGAKGA